MRSRGHPTGPGPCKASLETAQESIDAVGTRQESKWRPAPDTKLGKPLLDQGILRVHHESPPEKADRFRLEVKYQVDAGKIQVEIWVVEFLTNRGSRKFDSTQELASNQCKRKCIGRSVTGVLRVAEVRTAKVLKALLAVSRLQKCDAAIMMLFGCKFLSGLSQFVTL